MSDISTMTLFPGCCPRSTTSCILCWAFLFVFGSQCITMAEPKLRVPEESQSEEGGSSGRVRIHTRNQRKSKREREREWERD